MASPSPTPPVSRLRLCSPRGLDGAYRVNPADGVTTPLLTGYGATGWGGVELDERGLRMALTVGNDVLVLSRCDPSESEDCDGNGVADICDIEADPSSDCDGDGVPDSCAIASGSAEDCDGDGRIDTCPNCPTVEVVFLVDTSTSMEDEGAALCSGVQGVLSRLRGTGVGVSSSILGLATDAHPLFPCLEGSVPGTYGIQWPTTPPPPASIGPDYPTCPGGNEGFSESWGSGVAMASAFHPWSAGSIRLVVPIADEGAWCGDPVTLPDTDVVPWAAQIANANGVVVSPLTGTGSLSSVVSLAQQLAGATGGAHTAIADAESELVPAIDTTVSQVCQSSWDCDGSGRHDACELDEGAPDCDGNGRIDTCDVAEGNDPGTCDTGTP
ncbi:MAG: hypothetical protein R3F61_24995 [Myxococcota bacterium]